MILVGTGVVVANFDASNRLLPIQTSISQSTHQSIVKSTSNPFQRMNSTQILHTPNHHHSSTLTKRGSVTSRLPYPTHFNHVPPSIRSTRIVSPSSRKIPHHALLPKTPRLRLPAYLTFSIGIWSLRLFIFQFIQSFPSLSFWWDKKKRKKKNGERPGFRFDIRIREIRTYQSGGWRMTWEGSLVVWWE